MIIIIYVNFKFIKLKYFINYFSNIDKFPYFLIKKFIINPNDKYLIIFVINIC